MDESDDCTAKGPMYLAGCDKEQDFVPETFSISTGEEDILTTKYKDCVKNPNHDKFIRVSELTLWHLPLEYRTEKNLETIRNRCDMTVRIRVPFTSHRRPNTFSDIDAAYPFSNFRGSKRKIRFGTGIINRIVSGQPLKGKTCPCPMCMSCPSYERETEFVMLIVRTATHVIFDDSEAERAQFDCFFDSDDGEGMKVVYGLCMVHKLTKQRFFRSDACEVLCVTHDLGFYTRFADKVWTPLIPISTCDITNPQKPLEVIVSHPHGCSKRITLGFIDHITVPVIPNYETEIPTPFKIGTSCYIPNRIDDDDSKISGAKEVASSEAGDQVGVKGQDSDADNDTALPFIRSVFDESLAENSADLSTAFSVILSLYSKGEKELVFETRTLLESSARHGSTKFTQPSDSASDNPDENLGILALNIEENQHEFSPFSNMPLFQDFSYLNPQDIIIQTLIDLLSQYRLKLTANDVEQIDSETGSSSPDVSGTANACLNDVDREIVISRMFSEWVQNIFNSCLIQTDLSKYEMHNIISAVTCSQIKNIIGKYFINRTEKCVKRGSSINTISIDIKKPARSEFSLPAGATFTLPSQAEYAIRYYKGKEGWFFMFPSGTTFSSPDGTDIRLPENAEFKNELFIPKLCYLTYDIDTCPSSSGAMVFCNWLKNRDLTYFTHSGSLRSINRNRSGLLEGIQLLKLKAIADRLISIKEEDDFS